MATEARARDYTDPRQLTEIDKVNQSINRLMIERDNAQRFHDKRLEIVNAYDRGTRNLWLKYLQAEANGRTADAKKFDARCSELNDKKPTMNQRWAAARQMLDRKTQELESAKMYKTTLERWRDDSKQKHSQNNSKIDEREQRNA